MKTTPRFPIYINYLDDYLPAKLAYHIKIVLFIVVTQSFSILFGKGKLVSERTLTDFINMLILMEIFLVLAYFIFYKGVQYGDSRKEITRNIIKRCLYFYVASIFVCFIEFILYLHIKYWMEGWNISMVFPNFFNLEIKGWFKAINSGMMFGAFLFVIAIWQQALAEAQKLKEEKLIFKYETLRNQVNPHFLFNSLNTLSSLVSSNPTLAEQFIHKLSSIYRYVLENREVEMVDLAFELAFVKDYFYLQQIRDDDKIELVIEIPEPEKYSILPMSVQLLVENALKHNSATREKPLNILISLENDVLIVKNNLQKKLTIEPSSKIGLKNLAERVKFTTKKDIQITETATEFEVLLPLIPKKV